MTNLVLVVVSKAPLLSAARLAKLSDICADVALISLASIVLPGVFDKWNSAMVVFGSTACLFFWGVSLWLAGREK